MSAKKNIDGGQRLQPELRLAKSFFTAVGKSLKTFRLGDLLYAHGLITQKQLASALAEQQESKDQIGRILIRQGAISPVQLYRKLAEQWCLRASTAGITMMMGLMSPTSAQAGDTGLRTEFILASAISQPHKELSSSSGASSLFGEAGVKSNDISAFVKWTNMLRKFEQQLAAEKSVSPQTQEWLDKISSLKDKSTREKINAVNTFANNIRYVEDSEIWGKSDYWATPLEFLSKGAGDCEDYAIIKYVSLRALGLAEDQMRVAIVQDTSKNRAHAVLIVDTEEGAVVLDNQNKRVVTAQSISHYKPYFSLNQGHWWLYKDKGLS